MTREELIKYIEVHYHVDPEYLWKKHPNYAVFRHQKNRKWFALIMDVATPNLGLPSHEVKAVMDLKLEPDLIDILQLSEGYLPAYHMNKHHWCSLLIEELSTEQIQNLLEMSYNLTN